MIDSARTADDKLVADWAARLGQRDGPRQTAAREALLAEPVPQVISLLGGIIAKSGPSHVAGRVAVQMLAGLDHAPAQRAVVELLLRRGDWARADWFRLVEPLVAKPCQRGEWFPTAAAVLRWADSAANLRGEGTGGSGRATPHRLIAVMVVANAFARQGGDHPLSGEVPTLVRLVNRTAQVSGTPADEGLVRDVASLSAHTLGLIGDATAWPALVRHVESGEGSDAWLVAECALALARQGRGEGIAWLRRTACGASADRPRLGEPSLADDLKAWAAEQMVALGLPAVVTLALSEDLSARSTLWEYLRGLGYGGARLADRPIFAEDRPWPGVEGKVRCRLYEVCVEGASVRESASLAMASPVVAAVVEESAGLSPRDGLALYCGWQVQQLGGLTPPPALDHKQSDEPPPVPDFVDAMWGTFGFEESRLVGLWHLAGGVEIWAYWGRRGGRWGVALIGHGPMAPPPAWLGVADESAVMRPEVVVRRAVWVHTGSLWLAGATHASGKADGLGDTDRTPMPQRLRPVRDGRRPSARFGKPRRRN